MGGDTRDAGESHVSVTEAEHVLRVKASAAAPTCTLALFMASPDWEREAPTSARGRRGYTHLFQAGIGGRSTVQPCSAAKIMLKSVYGSTSVSDVTDSPWTLVAWRKRWLESAGGASVTLGEKGGLDVFSTALQRASILT
jgi:hypothetical protein